MDFLKVIVNIVAKNPPMALCVLGSLGIIIGSLSSSDVLIGNGWNLVGIGVILQLVYLFLKYR